MADVLFLHGRESGPLGHKARWLAEHFDAVTAQLPSLGTVEAALPAAREALALHRPRVLVGSSFGGALAVALLREGSFTGPAVLIAPAAALLGIPPELPPGTRATLFHGTADEVVPFAHSERLSQTGGPLVRLVTIEGGDHPLNSLLADGRLGAAVRAFLAEG